MPINSETILSTQTHPGDSTVQTVTGEKFKGDGYYGRADGLHTIQYTLDNVRGSVTVQATLATNPTSSDWFDVYESVYLNETTGTFTSNFTGNYVWVRGILEYTQGTLDTLKFNH